MQIAFRHPSDVTTRVDATPPAKKAKQMATVKTPDTPQRRYGTRGGGLQRHVVPKAMLKDKD